MAKTARISKTGRTKAAVDGAVKNATKKSVAAASEVKQEKQKVGKINFSKQKLGKMLEALIAGDSDRAAEELHSYLEEKTNILILGEKKDEEKDEEKDDSDEDDKKSKKEKKSEKDDEKDEDDDDSDSDDEDEDDSDDKPEKGKKGVNPFAKKKK